MRTHLDRRGEWQSPSRQMRLGVIADIHAAPVSAEPYTWQNTVDLPRSLALLDTGLAWLGEQHIDALALLGDLTEAADPASFAVVRDRVAAFGAPVLAVPGNCDVDPVKRTLSGFAQIAGPKFTVAPALLPFQGGGAGPIELVGLAGEPGSKRLTGVRVTTPSPGARIVLTHYPVLDVEAELSRAGFKHSGNLTNRAEIENELRASGRPVVVIHGHLHVHDAHISGSLLHLSCGALIEPPHHVAVIDIATTEETLLVERRSYSVRADDVERLPVFTPEAGRWNWADGCWNEA